MSIEIDAGEDEVDVEELGRELGETIAEMPEYRAFEEAKKAVERSEEAQAKIEEFEQIRQDFMLARQTGDATQEDLREVQEAQQELHSVPVMSEYLDTQNELDARLEAVNEAISEPLSVDFGEEAGGCCQD
ncbi:YlbF family regulator [Halostella sp. PRR32]|uniref:YlbF family regulator n=1 Tax=Halostella sp. PRR32 TaxID=3098147 RepID=UPI002B1E638C|nr:YlbF family regulator [Halostella sp. PRR32]